jgi:hypothetical protein
LPVSEAEIPKNMPKTNTSAVLNCLLMNISRPTWPCPSIL